MNKKALSLIFTALFFTGLVSCGGKTVSRVGTDTVTDLSGRWNDTDSRLVAEEMVKDSLNRPWVDNFMKKSGKEPTVIVGTVVNRSHEHINVQTFVNDLQRELTNSGRISFVAGKDEREEIRTERLDQARNSSEDTAKGPGKEAGADYMMIGTINTILDEAEGTKAVFYQVDLEMVDMANNKKVWFGQKKIKKIIEKSRIKF
ncbi:MAG: penicillin-binding protein activator LpoB [Nitrospirae bacterium]|nr:penicillin-binding protein activator LpoB [Candidatus Manganitrophaceae bacterium]